MNQASSQGLDLVQVSPGDPKKNIVPTCKMMDYGKFCYEQSKKGKEARKNQKIIVLKEIRFSVNIGEGDFETKLRQARNFLEQGNKVKIVIKFRGRENNDPSRGTEIMNRFSDACADISKIESKAQVEGRNMIMILSSRVVQNKAKHEEKAGENTEIEPNNSSLNQNGEIKADENSTGESGVSGFGQDTEIAYDGNFKAESSTNNIGQNGMESDKGSSVQIGR